MNRRLLAVLSTLCLSMYVVAQATARRQMTAPIADRVTRGVKILTTELAISSSNARKIGRRVEFAEKKGAAQGNSPVPSQFHRARLLLDQTGTLGAAPKDRSALVCTTIHHVVLSWSKGSGGLRATPDPIKVEQGDCIQWQFDKSSPGELLAVSIIDTKEDEQFFKKPGASVQPEQTDVCLKSGDDCLVYVGLAGGEETWLGYPYGIWAMTSDGEKIADPDLMVSCSGCIGPR